jgi:hypothetical protein
MQGASGVTFTPKYDVMWIFIALKNSSTRPGLIPRTLGPMAGMLNTEPPRTTLV